MDGIFGIYADKLAHGYGWISDLWLYEWETGIFALSPQDL
jgi:hypothetical protein